MLSHALARPFGNGFEQLVADQMSERIVDMLELIQVEEENGKSLPASERSKRFVKLLGKSGLSRPVRAPCRIRRPGLGLRNPAIAP
jgi:hypothetical protein